MAVLLGIFFCLISSSLQPSWGSANSPPARVYTVVNKLSLFDNLCLYYPLKYTSLNSFPFPQNSAWSRFFLKTLAASHTTEPRVINVDKNAAYPKAFNELKAAGIIAKSCQLRQVKY